jgi:hypothetical protein
METRQLQIPIRLQTSPCNRRTYLSCIVQWHKPCPALRPTPRAADTRTMPQPSRSAAATTATTAPQQMVTNTKKITAKHLIPTTAWDLLKRKNGTVSDMPTPSGTRQLETSYTLLCIASASGRTTSNNQPTFILGVGNEPPPSTPHHALHLQPHVAFPNQMTATTTAYTNNVPSMIYIRNSLLSSLSKHKEVQPTTASPHPHTLLDQVHHDCAPMAGYRITPVLVFWT